MQIADAASSFDTGHTDIVLNSQIKSEDNSERRIKYMVSRVQLRAAIR